MHRTERESCCGIFAEQTSASEHLVRVLVGARGCRLTSVEEVCHPRARHVNAPCGDRDRSRVEFHWTASRRVTALTPPNPKALTCASRAAVRAGLSMTNRNA